MPSTTITIKYIIMINYGTLQLYCEHDNGNIDNFKRIENFLSAAMDTEQVWVCHHRLETELGVDRDYLIEHDLYYNRPPEELVFVTRSQHNEIHKTSERLHTDDVRRKISEANKGHIHSEEHKRNISIGVRAALSDPEVRMRMSEANSGERNGMFGKHHSESARRKQSDAHRGKPTWNKGKTMTEQQKAHLHRPKSDEHKRNIGLSRIGLHWFNDGQSNRLFRDGEEPAGWFRGRK